MATHKSALKRIRQDEVKRARNRYYHKSARSAIRNLRLETDKATAEGQFPTVASQIDKLAKRNIIHKNKASNLKSKLAKHISALA